VRPDRNLGSGHLVRPAIETGIATLVCYAGVFGDVIGVEEMAAKLGLSGQDEFYTALDMLHRQGRLIVRDGFAGLPDLEVKIGIKVSKMEMASSLSLPG